MNDIYGTGEPIVVGSQVVVKDHGMGTVETVGCPTFDDYDYAVPAYHVRIEGDAEAICFPAEHVTLYADVYAGRETTDEQRRRASDTPRLSQYRDARGFDRFVR